MNLNSLHFQMVKLHQDRVESRRMLGFLSFFFLMLLFLGCRTISLKYNDTFYLTEDSGTNRFMVRTIVESVAQDFRFRSRAQRASVNDLGLNYDLGPETFGRCYLSAEVLRADFAFSRSDLINPESLAMKLKHPASDDRVSQYLTNRFSPQAMTLLRNYSGGPNPQLRVALLSNLIHILDLPADQGKNPAIYEPGRFAGVDLSPETSAMLNKEPKSYYDAVRLNRMLIQDAYPREIARAKGEDRIRVIFGHVSFSGKRTKESSEIERVLTLEFKKVFGDGVRVEDHRGWIP